MALVLAVLLLLASGGKPTLAEEQQLDNSEDEQRGIEFLDRYNREASERCRLMALASWQYNTNITDYNKNRMLEQSLSTAAFAKEAWNQSTDFSWIFFEDEKVKRQFLKLSILGKAKLEENDLRRLDSIIVDMKTRYSTAKICPYVSPNGTADCNLELDPDLTRILKTSRDWNELLHVWKDYRDQTGKKMRTNFPDYIQLYNRAAVLNGEARFLSLCAHVIA